MSTQPRYTDDWYRQQWNTSTRDIWNEVAIAQENSAAFEKLKTLVQIRDIAETSQYSRSIKLATWIIGIFTAVQGGFAIFVAFHPSVTPAAQVTVQPNPTLIQTDSLRGVFEKIKGQRVGVVLGNNKTVRGTVVEIGDAAVGLSVGSSVQYVAYRYITSVMPPSK